MNDASRHSDIAIVGAGPAGAHLAARLASAGVRVRLFDHRVPWEKPCGGGITHKAWSMCPILRSPDLPHHEVFSSLQISPERRFFVINEGHALVTTSRRILGEIMLNAAVEAGAEHIASRVDSVERVDGRFSLATEHGSFTADFVVGADGVRSVVREAVLGKLPPERTLGAVCQFFEGGPADPTLIRTTRAPGYTWAFARHNCLAVGAGSLRRGFDLNGALSGFMEEFFPGRKPLGPAQGALLPYISDWRAFREPRVGPGWALIGDAGGFADTLTGEGLVFAVWSGELLAQAFLGGQPSGYERAWRREFGWHLMTGSWVARYVFKPWFIDRLFTAITVCPALRESFMHYVWNLPPYPELLGGTLRALPSILAQWRGFKRRGGCVDPAALAPFEGLAKHVDFNAPGR